MELIEKSSRKLFWFLPASRRQNLLSTPEIQDEQGKKGSRSATAGLSYRFADSTMAAHLARLESPLSDDSTYSGESEEHEGELLGIAFINSIYLDEAED